MAFYRNSYQHGASGNFPIGVVEGALCTRRQQQEVGGSSGRKLSRRFPCGSVLGNDEFLIRLRLRSGAALSVISVRFAMLRSRLFVVVATCPPAVPGSISCITRMATGPRTGSIIGSAVGVIAISTVRVVQTGRFGSPRHPDPSGLSDGHGIRVGVSLGRGLV